MIDFSKITKTIGGLDCYYLGQRRSGDQVLHRFAVVNPACETIVYYNEQGQRIDYVAPGKWVVQNDGHQIIAPPKIVEVTRWIGLFADSKGWYHVAVAGEKQELDNYAYLDKQQHTFRFEVPND
jgi:hypothetical protein